MKRPRLHQLAIFTALLAFAVTGLRADIVELKSGEKLEGKVLSETDDSITMEYRLTPKIKDTKTISKADIREITRFTPAQMEFAEQALDKILPSADLMTAADYEVIIQDKLRPFVAKHSGSPESAEVEKIIETLSQEKSKVSEGQLKVQGEWLDADTVKRDAYNINAYRARLAMKTKAAEPRDDRYLNALREFDRLRQEYPASLHYVEAIPEAIEMMDLFEKQLGVMMAEHPIHVKQREDGLKLIEGPELQLTKRSIDEEVQAHKTAFEAQKKDRTTWKSLYKYDAESIKDAMATVQKQRIDLRAVNLSALKTENERLSAVTRYLADEDAAKAQAELNKLDRSLVINRATFADLEKQLTALEETLKKRRGQAAVAAAVASSVQTDEAMPEAERTNALAEALKQKQAAQNMPPGTAEKEGDEAEKKDTPAAESRPAPAASEAAAARPAPAPAPVAAPAEDGFISQIGDYIPVIGGVLLVILVVALFLSKRKKEEE